MAVDERGKLYSWGDGTYGELGDENLANCFTPTKHAYFDNKNIKVKTVGCGVRHSVVVDRAGTIYTFGDNTESQCGLQI